MTNREIMQQAFDAMSDLEGYRPNIDKAMLALHQALAQPEPVGFNGLTESETSQTMSVAGLSKPEQAKSLLLQQQERFELARDILEQARVLTFSYENVVIEIDATLWKEFIE